MKCDARWATIKSSLTLGRGPLVAVPVPFPPPTPLASGGLIAMAVGAVEPLSLIPEQSARFWNGVFRADLITAAIGVKGPLTAQRNIDRKMME